MYAKVFAQIYDGTLCTRGPWQSLVTFQQLLVLADQDGNVDMTASAISRRTTIPLEIIELGIAELLKPDPESRTPTEEGRRILPLCEGRSWGWSIVNYKHYRALKREEERREYHREYWHKRKDKHSTKNSTTQPDTTESTGHNTLNQNQPIAEAEAKAYAKAEKQKAFDTQACLVSLGVCQDVIDGWIAHRKSKKAPITKIAIDGAIREAGKAKISLEAFLREWIERGSVGLKADWILADLKAAAGGNQSAADRRIATMDALTGRNRPQPEKDITGESYVITG